MIRKIIEATFLSAASITLRISSGRARSVECGARTTPAVLLLEGDVVLSETQFGWQASSNRVMLLPYERCLQLDLVGAGRIVPIASVVGS
jgi:hypothetical protein